MPRGGFFLSLAWLQTTLNKRSETDRMGSELPFLSVSLLFPGVRWLCRTDGSRKPKSLCLSEKATGLQKFSLKFHEAMEWEIGVCSHGLQMTADGQRRYHISVVGAQFMSGVTPH